MKLTRLLIIVMMVAVAVPALAQDMEAPRPIDALDSVWIEELTWMEVRDEIAAGKTTAIIAAGSLEQNGPYVPTAKHAYVLRATAEATARKLGDALIAPIVRYEPGTPESPRYPGTIPVRMETYKAILTDVASSLKAHGFKNIIMIGDSGGNQRGLEEVTQELTAKWNGGPTAIHFVREYYDSWQASDGAIEEVAGKAEVSEGIHDDYSVNSIIMTVDPEAVRYDQRVAAGKASINGISIAPKEQTIANGRKLVDIRASATVEAIRRIIGQSSSNQ
jgi:creatinine amidohydrolase/Fe(II)-dependent formamide hydrolase-like protein